MANPGHLEITLRSEWSCVKADNNTSRKRLVCTVFAETLTHREDPAVKLACDPDLLVEHLFLIYTSTSEYGYSLEDLHKLAG